MFGQMPGLAVHGNAHPGPDQAVHGLHLVAGRMARHVDEGIVLGDDLDLHAGQKVLDAADGDLVAGDDPRREDHRIAGIELDPRVISFGDAGQRGARFALAAGADDQGLVAWQVLGRIFAKKGRHILEIAVLAGRLVHAPEGTPGQDDAATVGRGGLRDGFQAPDIAGEAADGDPFRAFGDDVGEAGQQVGLRARRGFLENVGRVADQGQHAVVAEFAKRILLGLLADHRIRVETPVAGMEDGADRRADGDGVGLGNGMGQGHHLQIERPDVETSAQRDFAKLHLGFVDAVLAQFSPQYRERERRAVDGAAEAVPEVGHGADMVLVGMGEHQAGQTVAALLDELRVGQDDVDPRRGAVVEGDAHVDHQPAAVSGRSQAVEIEVHPDLAGAAERDEKKVFGVLVHAVRLRR